MVSFGVQLSKKLLICLVLFATTISIITLWNYSCNSGTQILVQLQHNNFEIINQEIWKSSWRNSSKLPRQVRFKPLIEFSTNCQGSFPCISFGTEFFNYYSRWDYILRGDFKNSDYFQHCPHKCQLITDVSQADVVIFHGWDVNQHYMHKTHFQRHPQQLYIFYDMESPLYSRQWYIFDNYRYYFNRTAGYSRESDIYIPYAKVYPENRYIPRESLFDPFNEKTGFAIAIISNCDAYNGRLKTIKELQKYMSVDVYGKCGNKGLIGIDHQLLLEKINKYWFILSFENAYCKDYITEKLFLNGLRSKTVPVVFGATDISQVESIAPTHSFVYASLYSSMKDLSEYLKKLSKNEQEYAQFFEWKKSFALNTTLNHICVICQKIYDFRNDWKHVADIAKYKNHTELCLKPDGP